MRGDLPKIASLDVDEYLDSSVDEAGLIKWFDKYHLGAFVLEHQISNEPKQLIGALGIWPITSGAFKALTAGKMG
jgi:hypothetical protein